MKSYIGDKNTSAFAPEHIPPFPTLSHFGVELFHLVDEKRCGQLIKVILWQNGSPPALGARDGAVGHCLMASCGCSSSGAMHRRILGSQK